LQNEADEAEERSCPEKQRESAKKMSSKLDPFRGCRWRGHPVEAILGNVFGGLGVGFAISQIRLEAVAQLIQAHNVCVQNKFLFESIDIYKQFSH
jgi:hypothetical protein